MMRSRRGGFTLIEMLVIISIIAILAALLIPAVQAAREAARRARCASNMKMIGLGIHQHVESRGALPGGYGTPLDASYLVQILPHLEQQQLYNSLNMADPALSLFKDTNTTAMSVVVSTFLCPSEPTRSPFARAATNYAANAGSDCYRGDGPFTGPPRSPAQITDGLSQTVGVAEWIVGPADFDTGPGSRLGSIYSVGLDYPDYPQSGVAAALVCDEIASNPASQPTQRIKGIFWTMGDYGFSQYSHTRTPNRTSCAFGGWHGITAGSFHGGGVNVLFLDGRVSFVKESIDPAAWHAIGTRSGNEVVSE